MSLATYCRRSVLRYLTRVLVSGDLDNLRGLLGLLAKSCDRGTVDSVLQYARRNGVAHVLYRALVEGGAACSELARGLATEAEVVYRNARYRDELLHLLVEVLEDGDIDYVVFKTFNELGVVDVDVDIIVRREVYWDTVRGLISRGFKPIDDLGKTYATGFMVRGNPIVVDLHTEVTVLGVPYVDSETLFKHRVRARYRSSSGDSISIYTLDTPAEALVRVAHAVIKEAEIRVDDVSEVLKAVENHPGELVELAEEEGLEPALILFMEKVSSELGSDPRKFENLGSWRALGILRGVTARSEGVPPYRLPRLASLVALLHRMHRKGEIGLLLKAVGNLRYRRSATHIGSLLMRRFTYGMS